MKTHPTKITRNGEEEISIAWSDGETLTYSVKELRRKCPCANCGNKKKETKSDPMSLPVIPIAETLPIRLTAMQPVGQYAYHLIFSDGHNSGIYTFEYLRELGKP